MNIMDQKVLFDIQSMTCSYNKGVPVLKIENLQIRRSPLIFVVGPSGIGKSTFIEALGLMNNIFDDSVSNRVILFPSDRQPFELCSLWKGDNDTISATRNQNFSFIFQNTNLMNTFSAGENMCVSQLIAGRDINESRAVVLKIMNELHLSADIYDKRVVALSGGQRQRVAFVRAITADFEVLFGDEPTGNLDRATGFRLMDLLRNNLEETKRTAIIVSHDIELAVTFADQIIMLTPSENYGNRSGSIGTVLPSTVINRKGEIWYNFNGMEIVSPAEYVIDKLNV